MILKSIIQSRNRIVCEKEKILNSFLLISALNMLQYIVSNVQTTTVLILVLKVRGLDWKDWTHTYNKIKIYQNSDFTWWWLISILCTLSPFIWMNYFAIWMTDSEPAHAVTSFQHLKLFLINFYLPFWHKFLFLLIAHCMHYTVMPYILLLLLIPNLPIMLPISATKHYCIQVCTITAVIQ